MKEEGISLRIKKHIILSIFLLLIMLHAPLSANITEELLRGALIEGVTVDLCEPRYCEGEISTDRGGVITAPGVRIQARKILYVRKMVEGRPVCTISAEEDVMLELKNYVFVGRRLDYDFQTRTGILISARTGLPPWFIGGDIIRLLADGSYSVSNVYLTTSEGLNPDWQITADEATLIDEQLVTASNVKFKLFNTPVMWLPRFNMNLNTIYDHPFRYTIGWGGVQGPRLSMSYQIFSWNLWRTFARLDLRLNRGPGGGIETKYRSADRREYFETINFIARDASIFKPHDSTRYRFQGAYGNLLCDDTLSIDFTYDKVSDQDMATDYADRNLDLEIDGRTQLEIRQESDRWITNFLAQARVNPFETIKQQLPTFETSWRPFELGRSGIISDNQIRASYLSFVYSNRLPHVHDYSSTRIGLNHLLYRPIRLGPLTATPNLGTTTIYYGNSCGGHDRWVVVGKFGCDAILPFYRYYDSFKHSVIPYAEYQYFTFPTTSPDHHYIFDIDDGWYRLNMLRIGINQSIFIKDFRGCLRRFLFIDLWTNLFFDTPTIPETIQKIYSSVVCSPTDTIRQSLETAWDFRNHRVDHFNLRTQWTANADFAVSAEYRYRDPFDWRKVDHTNFILDSFRSQKELLFSQLSDQRNTFLLHFFYRFFPNWALEFEARHGWHKKHHTRYNEMEIDLLATIPSTADIRIAYQHRQGDHRFAVYFSLGLQAPDRQHSSDFAPLLEL